MRNWEIKSRNRACLSCQSPFDVGEVYHTLLDLDGIEPERMDYCIRCWRERDPGPESRSDERRAYWQARFKRLSPPVEKKESIQKDVIERLLDRYIKSEEKAHINLCYILALLEERKRVLTACDTTVDKEGRKIIVYEHKRTGTIYLIRDPHLSLTEVEEVQEQVKVLIDREQEALKQPAGDGENEEKEDEED